MNVTISPGMLRGSVKAIASKSQAHRALICAAFAERQTKLTLDETNEDIRATVDCLRSLGADIREETWGYTVIPVDRLPEKAILRCRESGSTLRFLLPVVGALGVECDFILEGRLAERPLSPLWERMTEKGCELSLDGNRLHCRGMLQKGSYTIAGNVSSQFVSGLLFAGAAAGGIAVQIQGVLESRPYADMTVAVLRQFGVECDHFCPRGKLCSPGEIAIEGDWSNAAFFLTAGALGNDVTVMGLNDRSCQGDRAVTSLLQQLEYPTVISAGDVPDLVPILAVAAACRKGAVFTGIRRLRLKESDRVESVCAMITALGGKAESDENSLTVSPAPLIGGTVNSFGDHRIAMAAAIAATICTQPVTILGAGAVNKSYPRFWADYSQLGGNYEQYLR